MEYDIHRVRQVDSTNEQLKRLAKQNGLAPGYVLCADIQTDGRAQNREKSWVSGEGGLYTSIFFDRVDPLLPLYASVAICHGLYDLDIDALIKWPNDIVIGQKKVCGILCEAGSDYVKQPFAICGFGINVNNTAFPEEIKERATSIAIETGSAISKEMVLFTMLRGFDRAFSDPDILQTYRKYCVTLGKIVRLVQEQKTVLALDVDEKGYLIVDDGGIRKILSGEVSVRGKEGYL